MTSTISTPTTIHPYGYTSNLLLQNPYYPLPNDGSLVACYDMRTLTSDGKLQDLSGNARHGTLNGAPVIKDDGMVFDGTNDYVEVADAAALSPSTATLEIELYATDLSATRPAVVKATEYRIDHSTTLWQSTLNKTNIFVNALKEVATAIAKQSVLVVSTLSGIVDSANALRIGYDGTTYFVGKLKRVRIWNRALTDDEVRRVSYKPTYDAIPGNKDEWTEALSGPRHSWESGITQVVGNGTPSAVRHPGGAFTIKKCILKEAYDISYFSSLKFDVKVLGVSGSISVQINTLGGRWTLGAESNVGTTLGQWVNATVKLPWAGGSLTIPGGQYPSAIITEIWFNPTVAGQTIDIDNLRFQR